VAGYAPSYAPTAPAAAERPPPAAERVEERPWSGARAAALDGLVGSAVGRRDVDRQTLTPRHSSAHDGVSRMRSTKRWTSVWYFASSLAW
jgi:hypothetical protein